MSITDELRNFMKGADGYELWCPSHKVELEAIADRIDAEHEKAVDAFERDMGMEAMTDENMAKHGWVRLPVDADGVPIHVGDVLVGWALKGRPVKAVHHLTLYRGDWVVCVAPNHEATPSLYKHYHPTVEDVLREMIDEMFVDVYADPDTIAEYAAKLRLAGEGE